MHERDHIELLEEASKGLDDVVAGAVKDARSAVAVIKRRRATMATSTLPGKTMLVKLHSSTSGEMIMFAAHARRLFDAIGKEGTARGVFTTEQLPDAIAGLKQAIDADIEASKRADAEKKEKKDKDGKEDKDDAHEADSVSLAQRASPLLHLMQRTLKEKGFILWEASADF